MLSHSVDSVHMKVVIMIAASSMEYADYHITKISINH